MRMVPTNLQRILVSMAAVFWTVTARAQEQAAPAPVRGEVLVILADEPEGAIDPSLAELPALRRPPFNAFHTMSVLGRNEVQLVPQQPVEVALPNGRQLRIELEGRVEDGRLRIRVTIAAPGRTEYLPLMQVLARPGEPFFVAGQSFRGGTLVIGVRVGQRPPR
jgi:hypothetical protein